MDIHSKSMEPTLRKIASRHGVSVSTVKMIVCLQFELAKSVMKKVDSYNNFWPYVRFPHLLVLKVKDGKKKYFTEKSKKQLEDVYSDEREQG